MEQLRILVWLGSMMVPAFLVATTAHAQCSGKGMMGGGTGGRGGGGFTTPQTGSGFGQGFPTAKHRSGMPLNSVTTNPFSLPMTWYPGFNTPMPMGPGGMGNPYVQGGGFPMPMQTWGMQSPYTAAWGMQTPMTQAVGAGNPINQGAAMQTPVFQGGGMQTPFGQAGSAQTNNAFRESDETTPFRPTSSTRQSSAAKVVYRFPELGDR